MKIIPFIKKAWSGQGPVLSEEAQKWVALHHNDVNWEPNEADFHIADGGEFLDDRIRMKEQPLEDTLLNREE